MESKNPAPPTPEYATTPSSTDPAEAERAILRQIAAREDALAKTLLAYAASCQRAGLQDRAIPALRRLLAYLRHDEMRARVALALGCMTEDLEDFAGAAAAYAEGASLRSGAPGVRYYLHNNAGYCLQRAEQWEEAERFCRQAIEIDPERANAYKNLGLSLEGQGRFAEAVDAYFQAAEACPADTRAMMHLGELVGRKRELLEQVPGLAERARYCIEAAKAAQQRFD